MKHMVRERCQGVGESRKEPGKGVGWWGGWVGGGGAGGDSQPASQRQESLSGMVIMNTRRRMLLDNCYVFH